MNIIGHGKVFLAVAVVLVVASIAAIGFWGLEFGIDYRA